jgi:uncharacterized protein DUF5317
VLFLVAFTLIMAVGAGWATGGNLVNLGFVRLAGTTLALAGLGVMVVLRATSPGPLPTYAGLAAGYCLVGACLALNVARHRRAVRVGLAIVAVGWAMNAAVIAANGGMPLSLAAHKASGAIEAPTPGHGGSFKVVIADRRTVLPAFGDVIPLRVFHNVVSAGDLVMLGGLVVVVAAGMRARRRPRTILAPRWAPAPPTPPIVST